MSLEKLSSELHKMIISDFRIEGSTSHKSETTLGSYSKCKDSGIVKQTMKQKVLLRKPRIQHPFKKSRVEGLDWAHRIPDIKAEAESNWATVSDRKKGYDSTYDLKAMMSECENIVGSGKAIDLAIPKVDMPQEQFNLVPKVFETASPTCECDKLDDIFPYGGTDAQTQSPDEVNVDELACYFENMANIPKSLSLSAEMMYT
ncbi:uncharacterized protein LOC6530029 [Drosophila yakuba]|uniref:Oxidative stress-responsive serine-rich protein 1 n=1 Tax=Drosophila yakuba TaxID=7245 RepID=B4P4W6_DROYA|nr:uncharacterized protein LOC6530029 [Drosophila yakuba]EDW90687.1 uncharacterized protein Dyak_GE13409 [Drosophila yakuba]